VTVTCRCSPFRLRSWRVCFTVRFCKALGRWLIFSRPASVRVSGGTLLQDAGFGTRCNRNLRTSHRRVKINL
jgi:hypothetical protein